MADTKAPALAQVAGGWDDPQVNAQILQHLNDGFRIVHMTKEVSKTSYVRPDDPNYHLLQHKTNSAEPVLVTYLARERK